MPIKFRFSWLLAGAVLSATVPATVLGQNSTPPENPTTATQSAALPFAFSGVLYLNYQYGGSAGNKSDNRFELARAYLNFRAASGDRDSVRVTLDVYQQTDAARDQYYRGWTMRVKYGFLQHELLRGSGNDLTAFARLGLIQTVMIEKEEQYWNRGLSSVAVEQAGYFNSSDAGAALGLKLPDRKGEVYATITNGTGYTSRETDRFKEFAARLTLTPWARTSGALAGLQLSAWGSLGARASDFASGKGTVLPVATGQTKNRFGALVTYRNAGMALGAHVARRIDVQESADETSDQVPTATEVTGELSSVFAIARPTVLAGADRSPWSIVLRADEITPDGAQAGKQRRYIVGSTWDLSSKTSVTFDVQSIGFRNGLAGSAARTWFLHFISNF